MDPHRPGTWLDQVLESARSTDLSRAYSQYKRDGRPPRQVLNAKRRQVLAGNETHWIEGTELDRVYFPIVMGTGGLGWVRVHQAPTLSIDVSEFADKEAAEARARALAEAVGLRSGRVEIRGMKFDGRPAGGDSWTLAAAIACYCAAESEPLPPLVFSGSVASDSLHVGRVEHLEKKREIVAHELPDAGFFGPQLDKKGWSWDDLVSHVFPQPEWASGAPVLGRRHFEIERNVGGFKAEGGYRPDWTVMRRNSQSKGEVFDERKLCDRLHSDRRVGLVAVADMGKSVRAWAVARHWSESRGPVIFLNLRGAPKEMEVAPPARWFPEPRLSESLSWAGLVGILRRAWGKARDSTTPPTPLLVLDGYDEATGDQRAGARDLIEQWERFGFAVLLTSRPVDFRGLEQANALAGGRAWTSVELGVGDPTLLPLIREYQAQLGEQGVEIEHAVVLLEQVLRKWEAEDAQFLTFLHRVAGALVAEDPWSDLKEMHLWRDLWVDDASAPMEAFLDRPIIWEDGAWQSELWRDAIVLWWLRNQAYADASDRLGWLDEGSASFFDLIDWPSDSDLSRAIPSWPTSARSAERHLRLWLGENFAFGEFYAENRVRTWHGLPVRQTVIKEHTTQKHHCVVWWAEDSAWIRSKHHDSLNDDDGVLPHIVRMLRSSGEPDLWQANPAMPSAVADALGWLLGRRRGVSFLFEKTLDDHGDPGPLTPGWIDALWGAQHLWRAREKKTEKQRFSNDAGGDGVWTFGGSYNSRELFELGEQDLAARAEHPLFFLDVGRALECWLTEWTQEGRPGRSENLLRVLSVTLRGRADDSDQWAFAVFDTVFRLVFQVPRLSGHFSHVHGMLGEAQFVAGEAFSDPDFADTFDGLVAFVGRMASLESGTERKAYAGIQTAPERYEPPPPVVRDITGPCFDAQTASRVASVLDSLEAHELALLRQALSGVRVPDLANEKAAYVLHVDDRAWASAEGLLEDFRGEYVESVLGRINYWSLMALVGEPYGIPDVGQYEDALAELIHGVTTGE